MVQGHRSELGGFLKAAQLTGLGDRVGEDHVDRRHARSLEKLTSLRRVLPVCWPVRSLAVRAGCHRPAVTLPGRRRYVHILLRSRDPRKEDQFAVRVKGFVDGAGEVQRGQPHVVLDLA
jgi:hypothetical protein